MKKEPIRILRVPIKAMSWNTLAGKNRWKKMELFHEVKKITYLSIRRQGLEPITTYPIQISLECRWRMKKRHDIDSIATAKPLIDSLVENRIMKDDDLSHVSSVVFSGRIGCDEDEVVVRIYSLKERV